ncbi:hypothetical protein ACNTMW_28040 [Planosporangium sp. 12N6]|uniref:hypothetical protein n=1 Tax=Planosporangium spinosum TaxID=3402278 RepID=UPI003CF5B51E
MDNQQPGLLVIERILRDRDGLWRQIIEETGLRQLTGQMLASSAVSLALYGAVLGANYGWLQALSSAVKLPLLFLATLAICLPTLYLFNLVFGARLSVLQAVTLIMVAITVTSVLTLAFAPISLFFLISAHSYAFFKLLNVGILMLTAAVGLKFLTTGMRTLNEHQERLAAVEAHARIAATTPVEAPQPERVPVAAAAPAAGTAAAANGATGTAGGTVDAVGTGVPAPQAVPVQPVHAGQPIVVPEGQPVQPIAVHPGHPVHPGQPVHPGHPIHPGHPGQLHRPQYPAPSPQLAGQRSTSMTLLYIWILLFGFVGTQLGWTLRPFFGSPGEEFALFRNLDGTFYGDLFSTIGRLLGA